MQGRFEVMRRFVAGRSSRRWLARPCSALALLTFGLAGLVAAGARAEPAADAPAAAQLFDEAQALMAADDFAAACGKLEQSQRLDPQLGTQLHLAHCYEKRGSIASAYRAFQTAARLAAERNASGQVEPREAVALRRAEGLEPLLSTLVLQLTAPVQDMRVELDGEPLDRALWGTPVPIDAGVHTLRVSAPERRQWTQVLASDDPAEKLVVSVPALEPAAHDAAGTPAVHPTAELSEPVLPPLEEPALAPPGAASSLQRTLGYFVLGAGVVGLGVGSAFGLMRNGKVSALEERCNLEMGTCRIAAGDGAARRGIAAIQADARTFATAATLGFVIGGVAAAAGIVLVLTAPSDDGPEVALGIGPAGIQIAGRADLL